MAHEVKLGELIDSSAQRDAIHVAIAPVVVAPGKRLQPGQPIGFVLPGDTLHVGAVAEPIGIVDPFLTRAVDQDERFWMFLFPNTITSLRHAWTHPAFAPEPPVRGDQAESARFLRDFADRAGITYDELLRITKECVANDQIHVEHGDQNLRDAFYGCTPETFWWHFSVVTGICPAPGSEIYDVPFSCSC